MHKNNIFINLFFLLFFFSTVLAADKKVTLQLSWLHQFQFAGFYMAKEKGFYNDAGLEVEIKEFTYDLNKATHFKEKRADFAIGRPSLLIDKAHGEDIVALGAIYQESPLMVLVTKESGIQNLSDLKNRRLMITDDARDTAAITAMLHANGLNLSDIKIQAHSFNVNDLIENKTDAMASYISNEPLALGNQNIEYKIFHPKDYGFDFYGDILYTSSQYIKNNPKLVKDFFEASMKGWEYAAANTNETVEVIFNKYNTQNKTKSDLLKEANVLKEFLYDATDNKIGCLDKNKLQKIVDVYKVLGFIHHDIDLDAFIYKNNPHKTYVFELSKFEIISLILVGISLLAFLIILFVFYSIKSRLLVSNSQLLQEVKNAKQELQGSYEELRKLTERYKSLFHSNMAIELIIDPLTQKIIDSNKSAERFYGYDRDTLHAMKISDINILTPQEIQSEIQLAKEQKREVFHFKHKLHDGTIKDVEVYSGPIELEGKMYLYSIIFDITQKIELEKTQNILQERLSYAMQGSNDGLWDWNVQSNEVFLSVRWKEMLGYADDELEDDLSTMKMLMHPDDINLIVGELERFFASQDSKDRFSMNFRMCHKYGHYVPILSRAEKVFNDKNEVVRLVGTHVDITEIKVLEEELEKSYEMLYKLTQNIPGVIYQYRLYPDGRATFPYVSKGIQNIYEVSPEDVLYSAQPVFGNIHQDDLAMIQASIEDSAKTMKDWHMQYRVNLPKKGVRWLEGHSKPEKLDDGSTLWHGFISDITERIYAQEELREQKDILYHQAHHDSLTGLPNRILFNDRLEKAIETAKRNKKIIALLFIDLDHFKEINDSLGHNFGDEILKIVSHRLLEVTRDEDSIARLGGDEFTIILEKLSHAQDASLIANKIISALSQAIIINDNTLYVSCSIGISIYPDDGIVADDLLKFADSAMYKAKDEGRNNFQYYNATMTELAFERVVMEASLREAIKKEEFVVYYQPQVNGVTDKLIGMEALVRWQHPTIGLVSPAKFIPLAESTGLIVVLDRFVMKTAMTQLSQWYKAGLNPGKLAMNLAVKQLKQEDFITTLHNLIEETGCKPEWLELEVTESQIMTNPEEAIKTLQKISDIGIELAVDDFGTGYSSLAYLKRLPINKLKIDQTFVRDLPEDEEDAGITKAVIALAHSLNLKVIAEGVETKEQRDFLVKNGCEKIQGYFYSKPIPADALEVLLKDTKVIQAKESSL
ncbi:MAG: EAL domain-containing protein [Sulfurimonas sp.]|nr:EAL domain-containing protein [Sulfurimonas sp.]